MEREVYLYPYSQADARRLGESSLWQASFQANVSCARDIEGAIRACSDTDGSLRPEASQSILDRWGFRRTIFVLTSTLRDAGYDQYLSEENRQWQKSAYIPDDGIYNRYFTVDTAGVCLDAFISQVREAYDRLELFGPEQCEPNSFEKLNYEGKVLVLAPDTLKESYWNARAQLWLAHDGFGCRPNAIGRSIRCTCLGDGEQTRWNRSDFIGVLSPDYLPDWAKAKLSELGVGNIPMSRADLEKSLSQKIESGWQSFTQNILSLSPQEIMEQADEIAAARLCRDELTTNIGQYSRDLLEFLNAIPEPLEYLRDRWVSEQNVDHKEEMNHVIWSLQEEYQSEAQMEQEMPDGLSME